MGNAFPKSVHVGCSIYHERKVIPYRLTGATNGFNTGLHNPSAEGEPIRGRGGGVSADSYPDIAAAVTEAQRAELEDSARAGLLQVRTDYLSSTGLQQMTGIPASTWRYWAINDMGPRSFKIGRRRVWRRADVLMWIAQQDAATGVGGTR